MVPLINTRFFALDAGYSEQWGMWCIVAYGPKHAKRTEDGRLRWQWRIEMPRMSVNWRSYKVAE